VVPGTSQALKCIGGESAANVHVKSGTPVRWAGPEPSSVSDFSPHELRNTAWSIATRRCHNEPLITAIAAASLPKIHLFKPIEIASLAWAVSKLSVQAAPLMAALSAAASSRISLFNP